MELFIPLMIVMVISLLVGLLIGATNKGVQITINHPEKIVEKAPEEPVYNEVYLDGMDPDARAYLEKHHGQIKI